MQAEAPSAPSGNTQASPQAQAADQEQEQEQGLPGQDICQPLSALPSSSQQQKQQQRQQQVEYEVVVFTGDAFGAGTDGDVFLSISGFRGVVEERQLTGSSTHNNQFERGNQDVFCFKVRRHCHGNACGCHQRAANPGSTALILSPF